MSNSISFDTENVSLVNKLYHTTLCNATFLFIFQYLKFSFTVSRLYRLCSIFQNPSRSLNDWRDSSMWAASLKNAVLIYLWEVVFFFNNALLHYEKNNDENIVSGVPIQIFNSSSNFYFTEKFRNQITPLENIMMSWRTIRKKMSVQPNN